MKILRYIWQLPQNILGLALESMIYWGISKEVKEGDVRYMYTPLLPSSVCLGSYIYLTIGAGPNTRKHEYGHYIQSLILGPLYLFIIGIPSLLHNIVHTVCEKVNIKWDYYSFYTEKWANKLGKVNE